jgi:hypothetical protein
MLPPVGMPPEVEALIAFFGGIPTSVSWSLDPASSMHHRVLSLKHNKYRPQHWTYPANQPWKLAPYDVSREQAKSVMS